MPSKTTSKTPASNPQSLAIQSTIQAATEAYNMATLGQCCIGEISTFLSALEILNRNLTGDDIVIHDLVKLGLRFADDHHNLFDCEVEEKNTTLNALLSGADHA